MKTSIHDLKDTGFVVLAYPPDLRASVVETISAWKEFCALPLAVKKSLPYSNSADGVGYELKEGAGNHADRKENFDVTLAGRTWLNTQTSLIADRAPLSFIQKAVGLVEIMKPLILDFAKEAEQAFGLTGFAEEVAESEPAFFVRFIHYFGERKLGEETASTHADQSGFTLHLFENAPGLQYLSYHGAWTDLPVSEGETVIIPAMQMQLRSQGALRALCHRVIATKESVNQGRFSAVCFVQLAHTPRYDKEIYGRLQERTPGFNYSLLFGEFSRMFKQK